MKNTYQFLIKCYNIKKIEGIQLYICNKRNTEMTITKLLCQQQNKNTKSNKQKHKYNYLIK